jgi:hypothetical protein
VINVLILLLQKKKNRSERGNPPSILLQAEGARCIAGYSMRMEPIIDPASG